MVRIMFVRAFTSGSHALLKHGVRSRAQPLKCVTVDVTGTLMGYKGVLGDYYCMAAKRSGLPCPDYERMHQGFKVAYKEMDTLYPCFGKLHNISNQEWWRTCVRKAFCEVRSHLSRDPLECCVVYMCHDESQLLCMFVFIVSAS